MLNIQCSMLNVQSDRHLGILCLIRYPYPQLFSTLQQIKHRRNEKRRSCRQLSTFNFQLSTLFAFLASFKNTSSMVAASY